MDITTKFALQPSGLVYKDTAAHALARALARHGVTHMFGQSLPSMIYLAKDGKKIGQVAYRQENAGGYMADAYARVSNKLGVVTAQNGPAATLLVAPLMEAMKVSVPVLALVQDVNRDQVDRNAFQEMDHEFMFRSCAKWVKRVTDASRIEEYIDKAVVAATSGRPGPAVLLLPADMLLEPMVQKDESALQAHGTFPLDRFAPEESLIEHAADVLLGAKKPVVIAGGGVHVSAAVQQLERLQELASLPVATTVMGKGAVSEMHSLSLGVVSYFTGKNGSGRYLKSFISDADVVLLIGNRTNQNGTDSWQLYPKNAVYIHIDIDPVEIGRNYKALRLAGDARATLDRLNAAIEKRGVGARSTQRPAIEEAIALGKRRHADEVHALVSSEQSPLRPERIMAEVDKRTDASSVVVADASYSSIWVANYLTAKRAGMRFITPRGLAGLGWGFPMAVGVKVARPESTVFCVVGDGGFGHSWAELETAVRMKTKIVLIVLNNGILGYQKHAENVKFGDHTDACDFVPVDHAAIARAVGANGMRVESPAQLAEALDTALQADTVTLIDVLTDPNAFPPVTWYEAVSAQRAGGN